MVERNEASTGAQTAQVDRCARIRPACQRGNSRSWSDDRWLRTVLQSSAKSAVRRSCASIQGSRRGPRRARATSLRIGGAAARRSDRMSDAIGDPSSLERSAQPVAPAVEEDAEVVGGERQVPADIVAVLVFDVDQEHRQPLHRR